MALAVESDRFAPELRRWRTARGLSQLDLAIRTGTSQRYVSFLEHGRSRPGRAMVLRLAETLGLSLRERNGLLHAAGYAPAFAESRLDSVALQPVRDALDRILDGHMPSPAVVVRPYGELVAHNRAFSLLTDGASAELLEPPVNVLRRAGGVRTAGGPRSRAPRLRRRSSTGECHADSGAVGGGWIATIGIGEIHSEGIAHGCRRP